MKYGIRKGLEDIAWELKGIKNILSTLWHSRYENGETDLLDPDAFFPSELQLSAGDQKRKPLPN